jgi:hypothetical protein
MTIAPTSSFLLHQRHLLEIEGLSRDATVGPLLLFVQRVAGGAFAPARRHMSMRSFGRA